MRRPFTEQACVEFSSMGSTWPQRGGAGRAGPGAREVLLGHGDHGEPATVSEQGRVVDESWRGRRRINWKRARSRESWGHC